MKKYIRIIQMSIIVLGWLVASVLHAEPVNIEDYNARVTVPVLNVRSGPSKGHSEIGELYLNQTIRVTNHKGYWRKISWSGGRNAYVYGRYLVKTGTKDANVTDYKAKVTASKLNIRSGPGTSYAEIGSKLKGQVITVTHHHGIWRRIRWVGGRKGYVHGGYLKKISQSSCDDRPDVTEWFESELKKQSLTVSRKVRDEPYLDAAWLNFYFIVKNEGTADLKQKQPLKDWSDCGVYFYGRLVSIDVPGNVLFGLLGHTAFEDRNDMNDINLEDFLLAGAGAAQAVKDGKLAKLRAFGMLVLGGVRDRVILKLQDPPCDQSAIQVGLDVANARGSLRDLVRRAQLPNENFVCPIS